MQLLKKLLPCLLFTIVSMIFFSCNSYPPLETAPKVDLEKYAGRWYEISSIPMRFQKGCVCTYAEYSLSPKGHVVVYNSCIKNGKANDITGKAFVKDTANTKLKVQFFWPFKGDYWIIALEENYQWALVGSPDRKTLWVLCRQQQMDEATYQTILKIAAQRGFDTNKLVKSVQNCK